MPSPLFSETPIWKKLAQQAQRFSLPKMHLKHLLRQERRLETFSLNGAGLFYDFSRQRIDGEALGHLIELAEARDLRAQFRAMMAGEKVNVTEGRAALHTACRSFSDAPVRADGKDVMPAIRDVREKIRAFAEKIRGGAITGSTGKPFRHIVVVGIGGSYLGAQFISEALCAFADRKLALHYLANVDIHNFGHVASRIDPETTLWVMISKSYTTAETLANTKQAYAFMEEKGLDPSKHVVTVTSEGSPGDDPSNPVIDAFHMFNFIGGRYSVTSAVGGVPLSLYLGYERFEELLRGAEEMDQHALTAPPEKNLPLMAALISVWNNNFLGYEAHAIIPYAEPLCKLAPHVQQLYMESCGKSVTKDGRPLDGKQTGVIIFGEPGTNAQHSFFQLAHQGRPFPIDFIGVIRPQYEQYRSESKGVTNHQELWANFLSQPMALAIGKDDENPAKVFSGNRPSSTILLEDLSPRNVGRLLAFYEHRTVFEAFIWDINPFDQFGVELGKVMASDIRSEMVAKNGDEKHSFQGMDKINEFYLEALFSGEKWQVMREG
ncbi:glucose-6-phosphate isomerase [Desulfonema ishimotonii]|uniref:Glucose-6-phosphate isomerase n=1 Tax=Desulfonema ishimotonii TaxID=45657 RepID=A0A401FT99_9BACT|nr:glucose-6-phosphate isomerase [Desulfonema ishimotonii]GBC60180.1 glucose-6-phosphate isomerase [Desulfonema ishimotonii]